MIKKKLIPILILMCVFLGGCSNSNDVKDASSKTNTSQNNDVNSKDQTANDNTDNNSTASNSDSNQQTTKDNNSSQQTTKNGATSKNNEVKPSFYGTWTISKKLANNKVTAVFDEDINKIIGKTVIFSKEKANCFSEQVKDLDRVISNPKYTKNTISKSDFEKATRQYVTFDKLGIKGDTITEISIDDSNRSLGSFYIKDKNTLILSGGGVYLQLDRK